MFGIENYLGFVMAAILLNLTPGSDSMYIITRSISQGSQAGFYSVLGRYHLRHFSAYIISSAGLVHHFGKFSTGIYDRQIYRC